MEFFLSLTHYNKFDDNNNKKNMILRCDIYDVIIIKTNHFRAQQLKF
jgi:hypothetical protein